MKRARSDGYHHGDLRRELLRAARRILARDGADALSLRAVAAAAGVSHAAPYHHFPTREALVAALASEGFAALSKALREASELAAERQPAARLVELGVAYVGFATREPELFTLMFGPVLGEKPRYPELAASAGEALADLERAVSAVVGTPTAVAEGTLASWSLIHGLATLLVDGALAGLPLPGDAHETARALGTLLARGLAPATSGSRRPTSSRARSRQRS